MLHRIKKNTILSLQISWLFLTIKKPCVSLYTYTLIGKSNKVKGR